MSNHLVPMILFGIAILLLIARMITGEKREFIISVFFIVIASGYAAFTISFSSLYFFFVAIVLSFVGDLLMAEWLKLTEHRIIDGIMAFGIAHIVYILAFNQLNLGGLTIEQDWWIILVGIVLCITLFKYVGSSENMHIAIKVSNLIYAIIIMTLFVFVFAFVFTETTPLLVKFTAGLGISLFLVSDGVLAYNEFQEKIPRAEEIIAVTYVLAQVLLQISPILTYIIS